MGGAALALDPCGGGDCLDRRVVLLCVSGQQPHPTDGRAMGLTLTNEGRKLMQQAEIAALESDTSAAYQLSATEQKTLMRLLQKIYITKN